MAKFAGERQPEGDALLGNRYGSEGKRTDPRSKEPIQQITDSVFVHCRTPRKSRAPAARQGFGDIIPGARTMRRIVRVRNGNARPTDALRKKCKKG
ncbi:hypothetical protein X961_5288 [Burkholderia pseudomallei MSHR5613]|nr:hypothetical protein DM75_2779 [Burkholderia mallei]KGD15870.1 hypothetical protein DP42_3879 [Burkholderia pseudomallei]KGS16939.1 hypothetical protein X989_5659 [Burkholderia pseudomallei MSHR4378]KGS20042.1 hypothetical protein X962_5679 [Burkholderia pseudomallei MSHR7343]KGS35425.1 hypothetical protein X945_5772 [Burkholderia pseudomallei ABCPW 107]KGS42248.1 hypothetical protein X961_5288 [Burkholderia pseudomallei MSHR5613]KGS91896.1 hypothetical protein X963_5621 [Burkholderia pseu